MKTAPSDGALREPERTIVTGSERGAPPVPAASGAGHLTSVDAVHWKEQPVALAPPFVDLSLRKTQAEQGYPGFVSTGYFTGSAQVVNGQPRLLFPAVFRAPNVTAEFPVSVVLSLAFSCTH